MRGLLVIAIFLISMNCFSQERQLIVRIPPQTEFRIWRIKSQLECFKGIHFSGYHAESSCLMMKYDIRYVRDKRWITRTLRHLNGRMKTEILNGLSIYDVVEGKAGGICDE